MIARQPALLRRLVRTFLLRPAAALGFVIGVLIVGLTASFFILQPDFGGLRLPFVGESSSSTIVRTAPEATENYLKGNQSFNADLMWTALTPEAQERFRARGASVQELQRQMDASREQGTQLDAFSYIGGQNLTDGTSMHFYLVLTRGPQARSDAQHIPYVFTLDRAGKISRIQ